MGDGSSSPLLSSSSQKESNTATTKAPAREEDDQFDDAESADFLFDGERSAQQHAAVAAAPAPNEGTTTSRSTLFRPIETFSSALNSINGDTSSISLRQEPSKQQQASENKQQQKLRQQDAEFESQQLFQIGGGGHSAAVPFASWSRGGSINGDTSSLLNAAGEGGGGGGCIGVEIDGTAAGGCSGAVAPNIGNPQAPKLHDHIANAMHHLELSRRCVPLPQMYDGYLLGKRKASSMSLENPSSMVKAKVSSGSSSGKSRIIDRKAAYQKKKTKRTAQDSRDLTEHGVMAMETPKDWQCKPRSEVQMIAPTGMERFEDAASNASTSDPMDKVTSPSETAVASDDTKRKGTPTEVFNGIAPRHEGTAVASETGKIHPKAHATKTKTARECAAVATGANNLTTGNISASSLRARILSSLQHPLTEESPASRPKQPAILPKPAAATDGGLQSPNSAVTLPQDGPILTVSVESISCHVIQAATLVGEELCLGQWPSPFWDLSPATNGLFRAAESTESAKAFEKQRAAVANITLSAEVDGAQANFAALSLNQRRSLHNNHMRSVAASLVAFAKDVIAPSMLAGMTAAAAVSSPSNKISNANLPCSKEESHHSKKAFYRSLLALREVMTQNAIRIFGSNAVATGIATTSGPVGQHTRTAANSSSRSRVHRRSDIEELIRAAQILATSVTSAALQRLELDSTDEHATRDPSNSGNGTSNHEHINQAHAIHGKEHKPGDQQKKPFDISKKEEKTRKAGIKSKTEAKQKKNPTKEFIPKPKDEDVANAAPGETLKPTTGYQPKQMNRVFGNQDESTITPEGQNLEAEPEAEDQLHSAKPTAECEMLPAPPKMQDRQTPAHSAMEGNKEIVQVSAEDKEIDAKSAVEDTMKLADATAGDGMHKEKLTVQDKKQHGKASAEVKQHPVSPEPEDDKQHGTKPTHEDKQQQEELTSRKNKLAKKRVKHHKKAQFPLFPEPTWRSSPYQPRFGVHQAASWMPQQKQGNPILIVPPRTLQQTPKAIGSVENTHSRTFKRLPNDFVPGPYTIVCGRGHGRGKYGIGNRRLRILVQELFLERYAEAPSSVARSMLVSEIIEMTNQCGSKFVRWEKGGWWEMGETAMREKVCTLLRNLQYQKLHAAGTECT